MSKSEHTLSYFVEQSFLAEVNALKPGNVHRFAAGHDMEIMDFKLSAELVTPILCNSKLTIGQRVYESVKITMDRVGCNTNLGMILLFTPIIIAAEQDISSSDSSSLQTRVARILHSFTQQDAQDVFAAIALANPGGLGARDTHDVNNSPTISIPQAMEIAKTWDRIALQYVTEFNELFILGYQWIRDGIRRWNHLDWAIVLCYLNFLSRYGDSHIARKFGVATAEIIRKKTVNLVRRFRETEQPDAMQQELIDYDSDLKAAGINPGTTADLTAASILIYFLLKNNI